MSITEARKKITSLENEMEYNSTIAITNHGREVFALMKWETYESIAETLDILNDERLYDALKTGVQEIKENKLIDFEDFIKKI